MDFVAIDFETANYKRSSACSLGIAVVENNKIVEKIYKLIKPEPFHFEPMNVYIHGINECHVINEPTFDSCWKELSPYIHNKLIVAHNASFDISVLRHCLDVYNIEQPEFDFLCTLRLAKNSISNVINYKLDTLARYFDLHLDHHDAQDDAVCCANVLLNIAKQNNIASVESLLQKCEINLGYNSNISYLPCRSNKKLSKVKAQNEKDKEFKVIINDSFCEKKIIFTGQLYSITREQAKKQVERSGGICGKSVTR